MNHQQSFEMMTPHVTFNNQEALAKLIKDMGTSRPKSAIKIESERRPLHPDFLPGPFDVICARGADAKQHPGNIRYREMIRRVGPAYAKASTKVEKTLLVTEIIDSVRENSPNGGFVKKFGSTWCEVGDSVAREKTGQCLRDQLHAMYRSSTKAKKQRRREIRKLKKEIESETSAYNGSSTNTTEYLDSFGKFPFPPLPLVPQSSMFILQQKLLEEAQSETF